VTVRYVRYRDNDIQCTNRGKGAERRDKELFLRQLKGSQIEAKKILSEQMFMPHMNTSQPD
jgi:hypothetical protein